MKHVLSRLIPNEPPFPYERGEVPNYPKKMPESVKYWLLVSIALNAATVVIATVKLHNLAPTILWCIFTLLQLYIFFFWRDLVQVVNSSIEKMDVQPLAPKILAYPSMQWVGISLSLGLSAMLVFMILLVGVTQIQR
jgi:hypothetical protein